MNNQTITNNEEPNNAALLAAINMGLKSMQKDRVGKHSKQKRNNGGFGSPKSKTKSPIHVF